jgi:hypothetical protein
MIEKIRAFIQRQETNTLTVWLFLMLMAVSAIFVFVISGPFSFEVQAALFWATGAIICFINGCVGVVFFVKREIPFLFSKISGSFAAVLGGGVWLIFWGLSLFSLVRAVQQLSQ